MTIDILLTVYNAEAFIGEQLGSLQDQTHSDWRLWVRDDGSTDDTVGLIRRAADEDERIRLLPGTGARLGALGGFSWLMENVPGDAEYTMFCDADDVWLPNKIEVTLDALRAAEREAGSGTPVLAHTDLTVVDAELRVLCDSYWAYQMIRPEPVTVNRLLIQNCVTGCTLMMNRALRELAMPIPPEALMHDWWVVLVASCFGRVVHLPTPTILYRQHGRNDTGARRHDRGFRSVARKVLNAYQSASVVRSGLRQTALQAKALLRLHGHRMDPELSRLIRRYSELPECSAIGRRFRLLELGTFPDLIDRSIGLLLRV